MHTSPRTQTANFQLQFHLQQLEKCKSLMAGKLKDLLEEAARKLEANTGSPFFIGDSLTIADVQVRTKNTVGFAILRAPNKVGACRA